MNDWVNCLRLVAFGQSDPQAAPLRQQQQQQQQQVAANGGPAEDSALLAAAASAALAKRNSAAAASSTSGARAVDVLLDRRPQTGSEASPASRPQPLSASQAAAAAASALAKTRQRQPSLLGTCKPQPPGDSPFIQQQQVAAEAPPSTAAILNSLGQLDTLTPTVRGQLISASLQLAPKPPAAGRRLPPAGKLLEPTLDEEEENMLYCSIEDNPSEHTYRVKVIETELSLRCQLKCYQLTAPNTISEQYEELAQFSKGGGRGAGSGPPPKPSQGLQRPMAPVVTFYQLIIGPQELTLLNDYATSSRLHQGLWSWPYQCIRRYGFDKDNCFMFEAGRKCTSGPGQFVVQTPKAYSIYQDVVKFVNELRSVSGPSEVSPQQAANHHQQQQQQVAGQPPGQQPASTSSPSVTQIPVAWAGEQDRSADRTSLERKQVADGPPSLQQAPPPPAGGSPGNRKQFFDTLRQLDPSSAEQSQQPEEQQRPANGLGGESAAPKGVADNKQLPDDRRASNNPTLNGPTTKSADHDNRPTSQSPTSEPSAASGQRAAMAHPSAAAGGGGERREQLPPEATSDETDESGYEQGDESVDSGSMAARFAPAPGVSGRKRQANDSMSSASSTSSSGNASPGQSVSRRSAGSMAASSNSQGPAKRPPIGNHLRHHGQQVGASQAGQMNCQLSSTRELSLHNLMTDNVLGEADFESNLMRDVYSEINKLHAKFAVTSNGSGEDSMSNSSSRESCAASDGATNEPEDVESIDGDLMEPMYSNVRAAGRRTSDVGGEFEVYEQENRQGALRSLASRLGQSVPRAPQPLNQLAGNSNNQAVKQQQNSYPDHGQKFDYLCPSLRPIYPTTLNPIPECGELCQPPPVAPKPSKLLGGGSSSSSNNNNNSTGRLPTGCQKRDNMETQMEQRSLLQRARPAYGRTKRPLDGLLKPTNHYVINDVQYAKISRNMHSDF